MNLHNFYLAKLQSPFRRLIPIIVRLYRVAQRIEAFVDRAKRCGLCQADQPPVTQLVEDADDKLFQSVLHNPEHTVYQLLPERRHDITYSLRPRPIIAKIGLP